MSKRTFKLHATKLSYGACEYEWNGARRHLPETISTAAEAEALAEKLSHIDTLRGGSWGRLRVERSKAVQLLTTRVPATIQLRGPGQTIVYTEVA